MKWERIPETELTPERYILKEFRYNIEIYKASADDNYLCQSCFYLTCNALGIESFPLWVKDFDEAVARAKIVVSRRIFQITSKYEIWKCFTCNYEENEII